MSIKKNVIANFLGKGWTSLLGLLLTPFYLKFLGIKAYGILGFFTSLSAFLTFLDLGLCSAFSIQIAKLVATGETKKGSELLKTLEIVIWAISLLVMLSFWIVSPFLENHWFHDATELHLQKNICLMGIVIGLQFPFALYSSGLIGLQHQVILNVTNIISGTLRFIGVLLLLRFVSPTLETFFLWQICICALQALISSKFIYHFLPGDKSSFTKARFNGTTFKEFIPFTLKLGALSLTGVIFANTDKLFLSKIVDLEQFGYYALATTASAGILFLSIPIFHAFVPRLTELASRNEELKLKEYYHTGAQLLSAIVLPTSLIFVLFTPSILWFWTKNTTVVENASLTTLFLFLGSAFNSMLTFPYILQIAKNRTSLAFYQNILATMAIVPLVFLGNNLLGITGVALLFMGLNIVLFFTVIPLLHMKLLKGETKKFYWQDFLLPLLGAALPTSIGYLFLPHFKSDCFFIWAIKIGSLWIICSICSLITAPSIRKKIFSFMRPLHNEEKQ